MQKARKPHDEARRLASLREEAVLDTGPDVRFDRLVRMASTAFGGRDVYIGFVDENRLWMKACSANIQASSHPRTACIADHALRQAGVSWIEDASAVPSLASLPSVMGEPGVRFYAAAPILGGDGRRIGVVAVYALEPMPRDEALAAQLRDFADLASDLLVLNRNRRDVLNAEEARDQADALARGLIAHAPLAMAMFDREMTYLRVSPRWAREFRATAADLTGRNFYDDIPSARRYAALHNRALGGESVAGEGVMHLRDGSVRHSRYEIGPWFNGAGEVGGVMITNVDVSDLVRARETAESSEHRLKLALEISDTVVWEAVRGDRALYVSGPWEQLFTAPPTYDSIMQDAILFVHPEEREWVSLAWRRHLETGAPYDIEHRRVTMDGSERWIRSQAEARYDLDGKLDRVIGVAKDITAAKRAEREFAEARDAAENANRAKSEFLANMSHELRTPLNGVSGVASALARTPLGPQQREMVELIETSAAALDRLLGDVLDLARVESGRLEIRAEPFDLAGLVGGVATLFQWRARDKGVAFSCKVDPALRGLWLGDAVRVRQVLTNLISNAVKFTAAGAVDVSAGFGANGQVVFHVADTGIGFDAQAKARLFDRFVQADGSITRRFGGTGLGLAIARTLALHMKGSLDASSEPGQGSTFTLDLPFARAVDRASPIAVSNTVAEPEPRLRVLLAEDHPTNRRVVELILAAIDADLVSVEDGAQAVHAATNHAFDVILMDMQMPVMDGLTALRAIRRLEAARGDGRTPAVVLTANALPEHVRSALDAGADEHLAKPVTAAGLLEVIARVTAFVDETPLLRTG